MTALAASAAFAIFALPAISGTVVYRWTDADGVVHFSDQPVPGAEKVSIGPAKLYGTPKASAPASKGSSGTASAPPPRLGYTDISISSPAPDKTYFDEPVPVALNVAPGLNPGHTVTWYLNGTAQDKNSLAFTFDHLDRGAYTLYATITDTSTQESINSDPVTFYVRETSVLAPQYPKK